MVGMKNAEHILTGKPEGNRMRLHWTIMLKGV
jgi:hypothetical protein